MKEPKCHDCGLPYKSFGLDTTLPNSQWKEIAGENVRLLCANCIAMRATKIVGAVAIRAVVEIKS